MREQHVTRPVTRKLSQNRDLNFGLKACLVKSLIPDTGAEDATALDSSSRKDRFALRL